jgi:thioredoxin reductase
VSVSGGDPAGVWDVAIVGAGPAGLSAALNLSRARRSVLLLDSNRPRNAATFASHGYLSRDGVSPLELRRLGREELEHYPETTYRKTIVSSIEVGAEGDFLVTDRAGTSIARTVLIATGLIESFPALPSLRAFYGTSIHSCIACDAYEYADKPIALIGETDDLAERAIVLSQWSRDLIVFTNAVATVTAEDEARLSQRGIRVDRRPIADVAGGRDGLEGITLADGETVPRVGAFVRPTWSTNLAYADGLALRLDDEGFVEVDARGRTSSRGVYAAGDSTPPGPQQLVVAAGAGATVSETINRDLITLKA